MADDTTTIELATTGRPGTIAEALDVLVRIRAVTEFLKARETAVKDWLRDEALGLEEQTGTAPTLRGDVGRATVNRPSAKPEVTDADALARWAEENDPTAAVGWRTEIDPDRARDALNDPDVVALLDDLELLRRVPLFAEGYVDDLAEACSVNVDDELVTDDGERIPGVQMATKGRTTVSVTPDRKVLGKLVDELESRFAIDAGTDGG